MSESPSATSLEAQPLQRTEPAREARFPWRRRKPPETLIPLGATTLLDLHRVPRSLGPLRRAWQVLLRVWVAGAVGGIVGSLIIFASDWLFLGRLVHLLLFFGILLEQPAKRARHFVRYVVHRIRGGLGWWRLGRLPAVCGPLEQAEGIWVRVTGRVLEGARFRSAGGRKDCVIAHYLGYVGYVRGRDDYAQAEVHGVDFALLTPGNQIIHVEVTNARFLERAVRADERLYTERALATRLLPGRAGRDPMARVQHEQVIEIGDHVEVLGRLHRQIDPSAGAGYRTPRLRLVLRGDAGRQLLIRPV